VKTDSLLYTFLNWDWCFIDQSFCLYRIDKNWLLQEVIERKPEGSIWKTPILFVHGAWHGAWCWDEHFLSYFAEQGYPSYALSVRGHGLSEKQGKLNSFKISDFVSDLAQVAVQLPSPPVLVGHSMGGLVVQKYLEKHFAPAAVLLASLPTGGLARSATRMAINHPWLFLKATLTANMNAGRMLRMLSLIG
jgi:pimeloyl-ACP methyl ester carboxylesterase